jgi:hypothetical protein
VCRSDCGRLGEPPGLNLSRRDTGIDAARVVSRRGFEVGIVMVVAGRHAGRAAPPILALVRGCRSTHRHIISGALSIDSGRHPQLLPAHNRSNPSSSPLRPPPRVGVFVLVSRRCVRIADALQLIPPATWYTARNETRSTATPPMPVILSLAVARSRGPTSSPALATSRLCTPPHATLVQGARLLQGDVRASPVALYAGRL